MLMCNKSVILTHLCYLSAINLYILLYTYLFICPELIEETRRPPGHILACRGIFGLARTSSSLGKKFTPTTEL